MARLLRVLIVADRADDAELLLRELSRGGFAPGGTRVATAAQTRTALAEGPWDVVLSGSTPTGFGSMAALALCREADPDLPFVVADPVGTEVAVALMRAGASDILLADNRANLASVVERELRETARRRARRQAEQVASRLAAVVESSADAILSLTLDGVVTSWNPAAERLTGWAAAEAIGRHISFIVPPDRADERAGLLERPERGEHFETIRVRKDGARVDVSVSVSPVTDSRGQVVGAAQIIRDITAEKRAAADRALLAAIVESSDEAIVSASPEGIIVSWNPAAERLFGYTPEEAVGQSNFLLLVPPDRMDESQERVERVRRGERLPPLETVRFRKGGAEIHVAVTVSAVRVEGRVVALAAVYRDITERRQAEAALRLRDRAVQATTQGILITDPNQADNPIVYASPGFERLTGYAEAEVLGRNCRFLQGKDTDPEVVAQVGAAIQAGRPCTVELKNYKKDGTPFWNELSISPVRAGEGPPTHYIGVQTDVTQRRRLEEQYHQAQKMEAVGQLAGGIAHDFNNLLTIIQGYADMLLQTMRSSDPGRALVQEIHQAGMRSAALTRQLLVFSRKQVVSPCVLDLNTVVADAEKMLRRMIGEDVRLESALTPGEVRVKADAGQLEQVLMNLCINARDAMPTGGRLTIETRAIDLDENYTRLHANIQPGDYALLAVTDTGTGMTAEVRNRVFEPFYTTKEVGKGTGLGLAVVHGIVKQAGGHVEVYSEVGVGTTFKVYLPRVGEVVRRASATVDLQAAPAGTETVLVVEDEDAVRALTRLVLAGRGYVVLEAADGDEALRLAESCAEPIHLLVTDVVMPGLGGRQVAERVVARHPEAKVLFVSGYADDAVVRHGVLEEQVHFLQKPFSPSALAFKVRAVLDALAR